MKLGAWVTIFLLALALTAAVAEETKQADDQAASLAMGRKINAMFYEGKLEELHQAFSDDLKAGIDLATLRQSLQKFRDDVGEEKEVLDERVETKGEYTKYVRRARFSKKEEAFELQWGWNTEQIIVGWLVKPAER